MGEKHEIQQGEHLSRLAEDHGFADHQPIWNHHENDELRKERNDPHVLAPGDVVFIPDVSPKTLAVSTGDTHKFKRALATVQLRLRLIGMFNEPLAKVKCKLEVEGDSKDLETDEYGNLEMDVPATAGKAKLTHGDIKWEIKIGHLDPVDTRPGMRARLNNLGYWVGDPEEDGDADVMKSSIEFFQNDFGLDPTGEPDDATFERLVEAHGS